MSRLSRDKGKRYERYVASQYRVLFGQQVRRGWQAREGDDESDVVGAGPFAVECKHRLRIDVFAAVAQACENARPGQYPVAHLKRHGGDEIVAMPAADWMAFVKEWKEASG